MHSLCIILTFALSSRLIAHFDASNCSMKHENLESQKSNIDLPILKFQYRHTTRMAKQEIINEFKVGLNGFLELVCGKKYEESDNQARWEKINGVS